ncbi:MAG: VWA domain-containing protein [Termitinemataceae bacterium]|nr:MAG: VWA domain-containing protein [Termitinemataceae bacterium]
MALTDKVEIPRRTMVLFFVIDTSGSMDGSKIGAVNSAIEEVIPALKEVSDENADAKIKVAALEFSNGARWRTPGGPVELEQFHWDWVDAAGVTDLGAACKALNDKLSTKAFMSEATGSFAPAIFLLSDGDPTDDWEAGLQILKQNHWFKAGVKVAVAIGDDANKDVLKEFTGSMEAVLETHSAAMLKKMIKFVSVRASQVASRSSNVSDGDSEIGDEQKQAEVNAALSEFTSDAADDQSDW